MARNSYYDALSRDLPKPRFCDDWTQSQCEKAIAEISEQMKGPLDNATRVDLHQHRKALRERLASLIGKSA